MILSEAQVKEIFDRQFAAVKDFLSDGVVGHNRKGELPEPWVGYRDAWKQRRELGPHIVTGEFPEHLFLHRAPNQTDEELTWMRNNYKQTTRPVYLDLENTVGRGMHPSNWSLEFEEKDEATRDYIESGINEWGSVYNFLRFACLRLKMQDAMGLLVVAPSQVAVIESEQGQVVDPDQVIQPDIHYFTCEQLWGYQYDQWYLVRLNESSMVRYGNQDTKTGVLCWLVDSANIWRIEQVGKKNDWTFNISLEFPHNVGIPPCINLMGVPDVKAGRLVWESPYLAVKDLLDIALLDEHWLRATKSKLMFPHPVMVGDPCDFYDEQLGAACDGSGWVHYTKDDASHKIKCKGCGGTGHKHRFGPFGTLVFNADANSTRPDAVNASNALSFVSPGTDPSRFIREEIDKTTDQARAIMHLAPATNVAGAAGQTPNEVETHDRAKDAFVKNICDQMFVIFDFLVSCMGKMRNGEQWDGYTLRPPTNYDLRTETDILNEIARGLESGLPPFMVLHTMKDYINAKYQGDPHAIELFRALMKADRLVGMPAAMIQAEVAAGRAKPWESLLHFAGLSIYERLMNDAKFARAAIEEQVEMLKAEAHTMAGEEQQPGPALRLAEAIAA